MAHAQDLALTSIAFPAISCGAYRFPLPEACAIAVDAVLVALPFTPTLDTVIFTAFEPRIEQAYQRAFAAHGLVY